MQQPEIIHLKEKKLIGMYITTSLLENRTKELWQSFKPRVAEISNRIGNEFYSVQVYSYPPGPDGLHPSTSFEKWAAVEVNDFTSVPSQMFQHIIPAGKYAVFIHKGTVPEFYKIAQYIYGSWLPSSIYELDDRDHFEILGEKYLGPMNPESEEEVWIPIKSK